MVTDRYSVRVTIYFLVTVRDANLNALSDVNVRVECTLFSSLFLMTFSLFMILSTAVHGKPRCRSEAVVMRKE